MGGRRTRRRQLVEWRVARLTVGGEFVGAIAVGAHVVAGNHLGPQQLVRSAVEQGVVVAQLLEQRFVARRCMGPQQLVG